MEIPKLTKIVVNAGIGEAILNRKLLEGVTKEIGVITGQKPVITKARTSIAGFKLRKGMPIGCRVTLRGNMMYEFLDRLLNVAIPRIRDFRRVQGRALMVEEITRWELPNRSFSLKSSMIRLNE